MAGESGVEDVRVEGVGEFVAQRIYFLTSGGVTVQIDDRQPGPASVGMRPTNAFFGAGHHIAECLFRVREPGIELERVIRQRDRRITRVERVSGTQEEEQGGEAERGAQTDQQAAYHSAHRTAVGILVSGLRAPEWDREGLDWPNRTSSRFVEAAGLRWHVQDAGEGPVCLLVHGTGASTHSFRDVLPLLARHFRVIAPDLPGHGFTARPPTDAGLSLDGMAAGLVQLLATLGVSPQLAVGHSAGAAILCRLCLDGRLHPAELISLNGALLPLSGFKHPAITPFIRAVASSEWVSRFFARRLESPREVAKMLAATGSQLDERGMALYGRLSRSPAHAGAALTMMAVWDVRPLEREIAKLSVPLTLVVGARDRMILPGEAARVQRLLPSATVIQFPDLGHLAHEERPDLIATMIEQRARSRGVPIPS